MREKVEFKALIENEYTDLPTLLCEIIVGDSEIEDSLERIELIMQYISPFSISRKHNISAYELIFTLLDEDLCYERATIIKSLFEQRWPWISDVYRNVRLLDDPACEKKIRDALQKSPFRGMEMLSLMGLSFFNDRKMREANAIFDKIQLFYKAIPDEKIMIDLERKLPPLTLPDHLSHQRDAILDALSQMWVLLSTPKECSKLFKTLDHEINQHQTKLDCDFSVIKPGNALRLWNGLTLPSYSASDSSSPVKTHGLLFYLIQQQLKKHNIEMSDKKYTAARLLSEKEFSAIIQNGSIPKEQFMIGISMIHGVNSHFLHWYLFSVAVDQKKLVLKNGLTLRELLSYSVAEDIKLGDASIWSTLIDHYFDFNDTRRLVDNFQLRSPFHLNNFLLFSEQLPFLRGLMLNQQNKALKKIQTAFPLDNRPSALAILSSQAIARTDFDGAFVHSLEDVRKHYRKQKRSDIEEHVKGIFTKNKGLSFWQFFPVKTPRSDTSADDSEPLHVKHRYE